MKISTKFGPNDTVWVMNNNKPVETKITLVNITCSNPSFYYVVYGVGGTHMKPTFEVCEENVYKSKEELLASL